MCEYTLKWCPREESNLHLILRRDLLYPLSYRDQLANEYNMIIRVCEDSKVRLSEDFDLKNYSKN